MAIPIANQGRRDGRQDDFGSPGLSYGPQPGSPTLTNPDMILPDYDEGYDEGYDEPAHPALAMWNHVQRSVNGFHDSDGTPYMAGGALPSVTPIIYGNGTMLSDIGEVTEVESTVGGPLLSRNASRISMQDGDGAGSGSPLRSSPTILSKRPLKKRLQNVANRERRDSLESSSSANTIGAGDNAQFGDLDDTASVDDSNFQGDDEESVVSEFMYEPAGYVSERPTLPDDEKRLSTHSISRRAEQILANAKRRLNTMEGNLNRARTFSYSSISDGSAPNTPTHSRNVSENNVPWPSRTAPLPQRSASALGASGGYRPQVVYSRSAEFTPSARSSQGSTRSPHRTHDSTLEPLDEDGSGPDAEWNRLNGAHHGLASPYNESGLTRSASVAQVRDLQDQMQGLKGRISSLRDQAKADRLKRRSLQSMRTPSPFTHSRWDLEYQESARENGQEAAGATQDTSGDADAAPVDEMTEAKPNEAMEETEPETELTPETTEEDAGSGTYGSQDSMETQRFDGGEAALEAPYHELHEESSDSPEDSFERDVTGGEDTVHVESDVLDDCGDYKPAGFDDYVSESGESLYHDTYQEQDDEAEEVTISHEDREDAFDYEHFFLHSAMGTLSRQSMNRRDSFSSTNSGDSVETTRGPAGALVRRRSTDTTTSIDTFATAREGAESRISEAPSTPSSQVDDRAAALTPGLASAEDDSSDIPASFLLGHLRRGGETASPSGSGSGSEANEKTRDAGVQRAPVLHRKGGRMAMALHRPSVSSFESTGTNRSFPLLNKTRLSTPSGSSDQQFKHVAASLLQETSSTAGDKDSINGPQSPSAQSLSREDQALVEAVVSSLGRCVLGVSEATRLGTGNLDELRKRLDAARRLLEGADSVSDTASSGSAK